MANVNTISFGPGQSNADLQAQQLQLQRQQRLADMLRQQSLVPQDTQVVSGVAVKNSPWLGAAQIAKALLANKIDSDSDEKQTEIGNAVAQRSAAALRALAPAGVFDDASAVPGAGQSAPAGAGAPAAPMPAQPPAMPQGAPQELGGEPQMSVRGEQPQQPAAAPAPQIDPETRQRWARALATYQVNPELGGKLIQELSKPAEYSTTPQYDQQGNAFVLSNRGDAPKYLPGVKARDKLENVNGVWQNPYLQQNGAVGPQDPNQPFQIGQDGQPVANLPYQQFQLSRAKAGAPSISTKTEVKMGESLAAQVGPILKESLAAAQGAQGQIDAADRIVQAVDTNKLFTGPLASKRLTLAQYGQAFGVGGKDDAEKIANTRQAIRGFAELTLEGRKLMSGQGQITNQESALAERAMSGDIDSLTPAEIRIVANASKRVAQHKIANHQRLVNKTRADKNTAGLAEYYDLTPMGGSSVDDLLKKYGGQ